MRFTNSRQFAEQADHRLTGNYHPVQPAPIEQAIEPAPAMSESEIRAMHDAWREKQQLLDEEWRAFHRDVGQRISTEKRSVLQTRQAALNAEREALPPLPQVSSSGISVKRLMQNMRKWEREQRFKNCMVED